MRLHTLLLILTAGILGMEGICQPMKVAYEHSAPYRWLRKEVLENSLLDNMETLENWVPFTLGAQHIIDSRMDNRPDEANRIITEMSLSIERSRDEGHSLQMRLPDRKSVV